MKANRSREREGALAGAGLQRCCEAFGRWELLVLVGVVLLIAAWALFLPAFANGKPTRINCVSNLKQVGMALLIWANDHEDRFPHMVSTNDGGTMEFKSARDTYRHFAVISSELGSAKVLWCPSDTARNKAPDWVPEGNWNLSYFIGLDADPAASGRLLSGDRNVVGGGVGAIRVWSDPTRVEAAWSKKLHKREGNILLSDGSVWQVGANGLRAGITNSFTNGLKQVRLQLP